MKKAILHIGMHKTGSSSIQRTFTGYDDGNLRYAAPVRYPNHGVFIRELLDDSTEGLRFSKLKNRSAHEVAKRRRMLEANLIKELATPTPVLLFSGEGMSSLDGDQIDRFTRWFEEAGREISVLAYVRDPLSYTGSAFQEQVKSSTHRAPRLTAPKYRERFEPWLDRFGDRVTLRPFTPKAFANGSVVADFADLIGIPAPTEEKRVNTGLSAEAVYVAWRLNRLYPDAQRDKRSWTARNSVVTGIGDASPGLAFKAPGTLISAIKGLGEDVAWLADRTGIDYRAQLETLDPPPARLGPKAFDHALRGTLRDDVLDTAITSCERDLGLTTGTGPLTDERLTRMVEAALATIDEQAPKPASLRTRLLRRMRRRTPRNA